MTDRDDIALDARAIVLREAFARTFAEPRADVDLDFEDLLAIRISEEPYALRVTDIAEIAGGRRIVPTPTHVAALLGLAGIRGGVLPVYSLAVLLGHPHAPGAGRFFAIHSGGERCALAFDELEAYVRVPTAEIVLAAQGGTFVRSMVHVRGAMRAILDLDAMIASLGVSTRERPSVKES